MRRAWWRAGAGALVAGAGFVGLGAAPASAHPLGNFTVNTYSGLLVGRDAIAVDLVVDLAEIPTLQRKGDVDGDGDGSVSPGERRAYATGECATMARRLELRVDDRLTRLDVGEAQLAFAQGQAGLVTARITCELRASTEPAAGDRRVSFANANFVDRAGWREVTAAGDGTTLVRTDVPATSVSRRLTSYPQDLLSSPLDRRDATLLVRPGGPAATAPDGAPAGPTGLLPGSVDRATRVFTSFIGRQDLTLGFIVLALLGSLVLGAIHALAPGHGKTVMAAYLVGQRGSLRQAMVVAVTVTATHTLGVLALGVAISASAVVAPERVYPWLGTASGVILAVVGAGLLTRAIRGRGGSRGHSHSHSHGHGGHEHGGHGHGDHGHGDHDHGDHDHGDHGHGHGQDRARIGDGLVTRRGLLAMGFVGGLLPSPSAVVVLLGASALGRAWLGVVLVVAYGVGMAATLAGAGLLLLRARRVLDRRLVREEPRRWLQLSSRALPPATGGAILVVGLYLATRGVAQI